MVLGCSSEKCFKKKVGQSSVSSLLETNIKICLSNYMCGPVFFAVPSTVTRLITWSSLYLKW